MMSSKPDAMDRGEGEEGRTAEEQDEAAEGGPPADRTDPDRPRTPADEERGSR